MSPTNSGRQKRGRPKGALSSIHPGRLSAALHLRDMSLNRLAQRTGVHYETVRRIKERGRQHKATSMDPDQLRRIADVLGVPVRWLSGQRDTLPGASYEPDLVKGAFDAPDRIHLAQSDFMRPCYRALRRDFPPADSPDADAADKVFRINPDRIWSARGGHWPGIIEGMGAPEEGDSGKPGVELALRRLVNPEWWVASLSPPASPDQPYEVPLTPTKRVEAVEALTKAFAIILSPWIRGEAKLNLELLDRLGG
jgi:transcriptional regulator with XRE-family HTH domain